MTNSEPVQLKPLFTVGDAVVYPGHGVGVVTDIEIQHIAGHKIQLFVISFEQDRMTLRVPFGKVKSSGLRKVSTRQAMTTALEALKAPTSIKRAIWNRRALEYTAKINSGDLTLIAQVVRDLHRTTGERERSHSERLLYEQALGRLSHEVAAIEKTQVEVAVTKLELMLNAA